jgi:alcohol dehydrogenase (cytochrome c)
MDRHNGQIIGAKPYTEVNWTRGIDQKTGKPLEYDPTKDIQTYAGIGNLDPALAAKKVCPSHLGGNNFWPSSYSQKTRLLYIPALSNCATITIDQEKHNKERGWSGGLSTVTDRWESDLIAADPVTQEVRKSVHLRYANQAGMLSTAGGLVFLALLDGTVAAYDDTTLDELWKINLGTPFKAPPMTFEVNGRQYVAIASGPSSVARSKLVNTPELKEMRNATVLYVFGL